MSRSWRSSCARRAARRSRSLAATSLRRFPRRRSESAARSSRSRTSRRGNACACSRSPRAGRTKTPRRSTSRSCRSRALVAKDGETVRLARSLDRPLRYFLAKRADGPMLVVSDRIDAIASFLASEGLLEQFQPAYTRMVPAHHVVEIRLVGCPDPDPVYRRFFAPERATLPPDLDVIGEAYTSAAAAEVDRWLAQLGPKEPIGVLFSGGADSGLVFLLTERLLRARGESPARLKAFTLDAGGGRDAAQARDFLCRLRPGLPPAT